MIKIINLLLPKIQFYFLGEVVGGLVQGLGSMFGASTSAEAATRNIKKQIAWERERATNAHQWEVEDLKKAGLNPILSAGGGGAQTGGISPQMPDTSGYSSAGAAFANSIQNAIVNKQRQQEINSSVALQQAQAQEAKANAELVNKRLDEIDATIGNLTASAGLMGQQTHTAESQMRHYNQLIEESKAEAKKLEQEIDNLSVEQDILEQEKEIMPDKRKRIKVDNKIKALIAEKKRKQNKLFYVDKGFEYAQRVAGIVGYGLGGFGLGAIKGVINGAKGQITKNITKKATKKLVHFTKNGKEYVKEVKFK